MSILSLGLLAPILVIKRTQSNSQITEPIEVSTLDSVFNRINDYSLIYYRLLVTLIS